MATRPQPNTYYFYGFVSVDLNLTRIHNATSFTCPASDPDIAGIGVVISFLIAGLMTTFASITAAILECRIDDHTGTIFLPGFLHRRLARNQTKESIEKCRFWRNILQRLILNLADQQLITGFSLLVIGYIVQPWPLSERGKSWPSRLSLVIYLSCLSSSSHLACMLTLNRYLEGHSRLAKLRIFFIILFAIILSISIGLGQTFSVVGYVLSLILGSVHSRTAYKTSQYIGSCLLYGLPPLIALHVYWTGVLQLIPTTQEDIKKFISRFYHCCGSRIVPGRALNRMFGPKSKKLRSTIKGVLWWCLFLNPPMIFASQILFAMISITLILLQKFAGPHPDSLCYDCRYWYACKGLNNQEENQWGFGQMLAMFVLVLPILGAVETYTEEKEEYLKRMEQLQHPGKSLSSSPSHSRSTSAVALMDFRSPSPNATLFGIPSPEFGAPFGQTPSFRSATSQYFSLPTVDPFDLQAGDGNGQSSQAEATPGHLTPLQRLHHPNTA